LLDFGLPTDLQKDPGKLKEFKLIAEQVETNPLQFFAPHGTPKTGVIVTEPDGEQVDLSADAKGWPIVSALDWLNDDEHDIYMNKSPNQIGKTCLAIVKAVLRLIRCKMNWRLFTKHGVKCPEWRGPKTLLVMGYDRGQLSEVAWPELQKWLPDSELGPYRSAARGGTQEPAWDRRPKINLQESKSRLIFLTYEQKSTALAGVKADIVVADEQMPDTHWSELRVRGRTRGGIKVYMPFTPHQVEGRADTGGNSFLRDIWSGENTYGHKVCRTRISLKDVPDYLVTQVEKQKALEDCIIIPKRMHDDLALRRGRARYWGIDEEGASLFYPEFSRRHHVVNWTHEDTKKLPGHYVRFMDHGWAAPTACIWVWCSTFGEFVIYDEYYVKQRQAYEHSMAIIKQSGNIPHLMDRHVNTSEGTIQQVKERVPQKGGQRFLRTELDWHSFEREGGAMSLGDMYRTGGLDVVPSTTAKIEKRSHALRMLLRVDPNKKHLVTGDLGAPRLYIASKCRWAIHELEHCAREVRQSGENRHNPKEKRAEKDDHLIDCMEYLAVRFASELGVSNKQLKKGIIYR
jgi:hypothetical protein